MVSLRTWCLRGGVLPDRPDLGPVDLVIRGETIAEVLPAGTADTTDAVDVGESWVLPGAVDAHVHPIHAETLASVGEESLLGGITTVLNHLYPEPGEPLVDTLARGRREAATASADFGFHLRLTPDRLGTTGVELVGPGLSEVVGEPGLLSVKAFMAHGNPAVACRPEHLVPIAAAAAAANLPLIVHAEFGQVIDAFESLLGVPSGLAEHDALRSAELEAAAVATAAAIARCIDVRLYVAHLSSPEAVQAVIRAREAGVRIMGETCPHYLFLDTDHRPDVEGRVTPPLRSAQSSSCMRELVAAGQLDVLASDHCGYDAGDKPDGNFAAADNGLPGLDCMIPMVLDSVLESGWLRLPAVVRLLGTGPARAFGLTGKGLLAPGADADVIVVDPRGQTAIVARPQGPATANSPYAGRALRGSIVDVLRRGEYAVRDGKATGLTGARPVIAKAPEW